MNNKIFQDMQNYWMQSFSAVDLSTWMKNMQEQNIHVCSPACNNVFESALDVTKANADFMQENMGNVFETAQQNIKASNMEEIIANNQQVMQNIAFNSAHYGKQMFDRAAELGIGLYEHYMDIATEHASKYGSQDKEKA